MSRRKQQPLPGLPDYHFEGERAYDVMLDLFTGAKSVDHLEIISGPADKYPKHEEVHFVCWLKTPLIAFGGLRAASSAMARIVQAVHNEKMRTA